MSQIAESDIKFIDFTGGEPTLAEYFVSNVSKAAKKYNIKTGIVTSAHWASNKENARRIIDKYPHIDEWDISTDIYHLEFVNLDHIITAYGLLKEEYNKNAVIRVAYHEPFTKDDCELILKLNDLFGKNIGFQPIGPVGRAEEFIENASVSIENYEKSPCPSTGLLIQPFGTAVSCCAPLSHEDYEHPLRLGNAFTEPISSLISKWRINPLLQTIRLWGFEPVFNWLSESGYSLEDILKEKTCHTCVAIIQDKSLCEIAFNRSNEFMHKLSLALSLKQFFNERYMENAIINEAKILLEK
jgi:hypothetical protein